MSMWQPRFPRPAAEIYATNLDGGDNMKFQNTICGKTFRYETPAELIEQIRPLMEKAEADYKALELKTEESYRKNKEEADKTRKIYYVFRKAIAQLGGMVAETPAKPAPAPEPKSNAS